MTVEERSTTAVPDRMVEEQVRAHPERFRVLTGDRPTGPLHLGHYFGTLANRVRLQRAGVEVVRRDRRLPGHHRPRRRRRRSQTPCGSSCSTTSRRASTRTQATIFTHSAVPALNQLVVPFLSLVTVAELGRNPTVKAEADATGGRGR